ncbi:MAG: NAD-dependent epimerase/dehydratase family protein [Acidobacteriota bacterium]
MGGNARCLIIGGAGFIGSHVSSRLSLAGMEVRVFDRDPAPRPCQGHLLARTEYQQGDIQNTGEVLSAVDGVTDIVYMAHTTFPASSMHDPCFDLQSNVLPFLRLLQTCLQVSRVKRIIYFSSGGTVYGNTKKKIALTENHPTKPISSYGLTKLICECYLRLAISHSSVTGLVLRPSNAYGIGQNLIRPQGVIAHSLKAIALGQPVMVYGDGTVVRDFVYVSDIADAVLLCLESPFSSPGSVQTYNVGTGQAVSLNSLLNLMENVTGKRCNIEYHPARTFDCAYNVLDCSLIRKAFGWGPKTSLREGIGLVWDWINGLLTR